MVDKTQPVTDADTTYETSKVRTKSGLVDGVFVTVSKPLTADSLPVYGDDKEVVLARLDELEALALAVLHKAGFDSWDQKILIVNGVHYRGDVPSDLFEISTKDERKKEIYAELGVHEEDERLTVKVAYVLPNRSAEKFAFYLNHACVNARAAYDKQSLWPALRAMLRVEKYSQDVQTALMERYYVAGRNQVERNTKGKLSIDWDLELRDWPTDRERFNTNGECDLYYAEKLNSNEDTIRKYRNNRGIKRISKTK